MRWRGWIRLMDTVRRVSVSMFLFGSPPYPVSVYAEMASPRPSACSQPGLVAADNVGHCVQWESRRLHRSEDVEVPKNFPVMLQCVCLRPAFLRMPRSGC